MWPTILDTGALLVAVVGVYLILCRLRAIRSQIGSSSTASLYGQMIEIDRYFASNPELKHYFYGGKTIIESDDRYETVRSLAEMMADLIEHAYVQRNCLPPNVWPQWLEYFTDIYNDSSMLRFHLAEAKSKSWYANEILQLIEEVNLKRKKQGANTTSDADSSSSQG